ncbi:importin subunit alpha-5 [Galendromus occidentalis]|uniref:Importin subunit alpha n=1 Tax=Galendromus occidentalis TaxID=34638 RepID=A0AAJ6VW27_9ACAR|nr:importin subunit alpha-5 [Galendromus occidentalis]
MAPNDRLSQFKNRGKDLETNRNRRKDDVIELRKARKDEQLSKRRNVAMVEPTSDTDETDQLDQSSPQPGQNVAVTDIEKLVQGMHSNDLDEVYRSTHLARKILSRERNPPIDKFIAFNAVPRLVQLLERDDRPDLQFETAWALTNIASGNSEQTECVVKSGSCDHFIRLLSSPAINVAEQAVWALANIAGEGPAYRDMIIDLGVVPALTRLVKPTAAPSFLANVAWCLSNLCRNKNPPPPLHAIQACLPSVKQLLMHDSPSVVSDACWSLSYISDGDNDRIQMVLSLGILDRIVALARNSNDRNLAIPALRTLGNIVTGTDDQTQVVIDHGALLAFKHLLLHPTLNLRKEVSWALSNITAGRKEQVQAVIDNGLLSLLIDLLKNGDSRTQKEACWAVCNLTCSGTVEQIACLFKEGGMQPLVDMLGRQDTKITGVILDSIQNILRAADSLNRKEALCEILEEYGLVDHLERLQMHSNIEIYEMAAKLIEEHWGGEEDETAAPDSTTADGTEFDFNPNGSDGAGNPPPISF